MIITNLDTLTIIEAEFNQKDAATISTVFAKYSQLGC